MGYIYKITNQINGKIYIGQTRFSVEQRYKQHLYEANKGELSYPLYKAIRKYGNENFKVETIEEIDDKELNKREKYWIKFYNSYVKDEKGYNCTYGGEGNSTIDKLEVYNLWDSGLSISQISNELQHDRSAIRKILSNYKNYSIEESNARGDKTQSQNRFKKINQYNLKGQLINTFYNMHEAERQTGISSKSIWLGVHLKQPIVGGYQWRFEDDIENKVIDISNENFRKYKQRVKQIDKTTNEIINIYESAAEASRLTNISAGQIRKVCQNKGITAGGYKWAYTKGDD